MNILYLLKDDPEPTVKKIIAESEKAHAVTVIDLKKNRDYDRIIQEIVACDKVISW